MSVREADDQEVKKSDTSSKKRRNERPVYKYYEIKGGKATRLLKECPRCGRGTFLAEHKDRLTCGKCGYTSFKKIQVAR